MSEGSGRYIPLNLSSTSGSGYVYNIPVTSDKYVDANTYLCTGNTTGPFVLESAIHTRSEYTDLHTAEEFVRVFNTVKSSKERISMRNHFYRHILPSLTDEKFEKDDERLQQLSLLLTCSDEHISSNAIQEMQNLIFKLDFEKLKVKSVMSALKSVASQLNSLKHDSRDEGVRLLSDLVIVSLLKEKLNPAESKQIKRRLNDLQHSVTSKASKKDKGLDMKSVADFLHYCMKYTMSKEGVKLMESRAENSLSEKDVQELISNVHKISTIEIYLHLLGFLYKVNSSPMPMSIAKSYAKVAHAKLTNLSPSKDKRGEASLTLLADFILRGAIVLFDRKLLSSHTESAKQCLTVAAQIVCSPNSSFATLPCEMMNICSKIDQSDASSIWSNLGLSDVRYQDLVVKLVKRQIPGMIIRDYFNQNVDLIARRSDHSSWITMLGTFMNSSEVAIKLMIPGQHPTKLHIQPREETEFSNIESEFEILKYIQRCQQHTNVAQMVAFYDTNPRSVAMFAVEIYEISLLKYLYDVRSRNDELTLDWKIQRCLEMLNAVDFIHHHDIVHRDIMAASFSIRCQGQDHEIAVLTSFKRAIHNDEEGGTSTIGHVRDLNATQIPTRWTAPESFLQDKFDRKSDIWMFGHVIREVFTYGCQPYTEIYSEDTENIMVKVLCCGLKPYKWRCIPMDIHSLTLKCFENDPGNRPSNQKIYSSLQEFHKKEKKDIQNKDANRRFSRNRTSSSSTHGLCINYYPKLSDGQIDSEPERGIPKLIQDLRKQKSEGDRRATYISLKYQGNIPRSIYTVSEEELSSPDIPKILGKGNRLIVKEPVSKFFYEKILKKMSSDFAAKMQIRTWPLDPQLTDENSEHPFELEYETPNGKCVMHLASLPFEEREHLNHMLEVVLLMEKMHGKYWILVDVCGQNLYLTTDKKEAFMPRIGRMLRLELPYDPDIDVVDCPFVYKNRIHWQPVEVIRNCEYSMSSDVYMLAMVFYEYYSAVGLRRFGSNDQSISKTATVPFASVEYNQMLEKLLSGELPLKPSECPLWLYENIMVPCWSQERTSRPSISQIVSLMKERLSDTEDYDNCHQLTGDDEYDHRYLRCHSKIKSTKDQACGGKTRVGVNFTDSNEYNPASFKHHGKDPNDYTELCRDLDIDSRNRSFPNTYAKDSSALRSYSSLNLESNSHWNRKQVDKVERDSSLFQRNSSEASAVTFANDSADDSFISHDNESDSEIEFVNDSDNDE